MRSRGTGYATETDIRDACPDGERQAEAVGAVRAAGRLKDVVRCRPGAVGDRHADQGDSDDQGPPRRSGVFSGPFSRSQCAEQSPCENPQIMPGGLGKEIVLPPQQRNPPAVTSGLIVCETRPCPASPDYRPTADARARS